MATYEELMQSAEQIRTNELPESNTHELVGQHLKNQVEHFNKEGNGIKSLIEANKKEVDGKLSELEKIQGSLFNDTAFIRGEGLPMILSSSILKNETYANGVLTPIMMSNFLLDYKLYGEPEEGYTYGLTFQYSTKENEYPFSNYIALCKYNTSKEKTIIGSKNIGSTAPIGIQTFEISTSNAGNISKGVVLLDFDALSSLTPDKLGNNNYFIFLLPSYDFDTSYLFDLSTGVLAEKQEQTAQLNSIDNRLSTVEGKVQNETRVVWELDNDISYFTDGYYGFKNIGQYTKVQESAISFNQVRLNGVKGTGSQVKYKVCIVKGLADRRDCPIGAISDSTHTKIKEGSMSLTAQFSSYIIDLGKLYTCQSGYQVVVYLESEDAKPIEMRGSAGGVGNPEKTSNVALFSSSSNPLDGGTWSAGSLAESTNTGYFNVALTLLSSPIFVTSEELEKKVSGIIKEVVPDMISTDIVLTIPDIIYAIVGTELNMWNDAVSLSVDKGLRSPINYQIKWNCSKGLITDRCFRFTPADADAGKQYNCTCSIYDIRGGLIDNKTFKISVLAKNALNQPKNIVHFGDSLGADTAKYIHENFNSSSKFSGTIPTMLGTQGRTYKYEAIGGYGWKNYATKGEQGYRVPVTGVTSLSVGAIYKASNNNVFQIKEVNIVEGNGNILLYKHYELSIGGYGDLPLPNGTLTKIRGDGDDNVAYSGAFQESTNPLWNDDTQSLDVTKYKTTIGLSAGDKINAASFQFGINDANLADDLETLRSYITDLYNAFTADNPDFRMIVGLTTSAGNDVNGAGANYGGSYDYMGYLDRVYRIRQFYLTLQNSSEMPNIRIAPISLEVDRYYGYAFSERTISQRYTETEKYHNNYVHPGPSGYGQMGDAYFAAFVAALVE